MSVGQSERILIVEDEPIICESLRATLEYCGYACETAATAAAALDHLRSRIPDAIVADLGLPDCAGVELVVAMRHACDVPIIVVSGHSAEADKIAALDCGADDYVQKPFLPGELVARVRAKLRHHPTDVIENDRPHRVREEDLYLSRMERALLALLVQHQGATVPEDQIISAVWGSRRGATSADLRTLVLKVRRKLDEQRQPLFVLNKRGVGYYVSGWGRFPRREKGNAEHPLPPKDATTLDDSDHAAPSIVWMRGDPHQRHSPVREAG